MWRKHLRPEAGRAMPWQNTASADCSRARRLPAASEARATASAARLKVLAAEDNATNQLVLRALLEQIGIAPTIVDNGEAAVEAWHAGDFDLILMDVQMPHMDGPSAARRIRARERETGRAPTPIIALTANAMHHQVAEYLAAGMDSFVAKPIRVAELYDAIARYAGPDGRAGEDSDHARAARRSAVVS